MSRSPTRRPAALLSAVMITALVAVGAGAALRLAPIWNPVPLIAASLLVAVEAGFVQRAAHARRLALNELLRYLAPELLMLLVVMRLAATFSWPGADLRASLGQWLFDPLSVFDALFALYLGLGLVAGLMAHLTARDLAVLAPRAADTHSLRADGHERFAALLADERAAALGRLSARFVTGGALLLVALSIEVADLRQFGGAPRALSGMSAAAALAYVVSGFLLHSRARLALLQSRWQIEGARVSPNVARRWSYGSVLLIFGVLITAALLPRAYGMGLVDALRYGLGVIGYGLAVVGYIITWLFGMLLLVPAWLLSLLAPSGGGTMPAAPPLVLPPPVPEPDQEQRFWPALVFWLCVAVLAALALRALLRRHPHLLRGIRAWALYALRSLREMWRAGSGWAALAIVAVRDLVASQEQAEPRRPWGLPPRLDPRGQVVRYYRDAVRSADAAGQPRRASQTPEEYRRALDAGIPEAAPDFDELTDAYTHARYAPRQVTREQARLARGPWQRLRRLLRRYSQSRHASGDHKG